MGRQPDRYAPREPFEELFGIPHSGRQANPLERSSCQSFEPGEQEEVPCDHLRQTPEARPPTTARKLRSKVAS